MSWMQVLSETYDNCRAEIADDSKKAVLLPLSHLTAEAQITVIIDINGEFVGGETVPKDNATTIIPVTEDSAARSSGVAPHPLCDKLIYTAGDYSRYVKDDKKDYTQYYSEYIKLLGEWKNSDCSTEKVEAIYNYLSRARLIEDLVNIRLLVCDDQGLLDSKVKISGTAQSECFIRFKVLKTESPYYTSETWKDKELFESFIEFSSIDIQNKGICYVTGENSPIYIKHPAKIRNTADKAKLISSNNEKSFVFKGRFLNAEEAATIGYETTQKAHNALRWLIAKQGYKNGSNAIVSWCTRGTELPDVLDDSDTLFSDLPESENVPVYTGEDFAKKLNKAIAGKSEKIDDTDKIVIMSVDTADGSTNGRLSIKFYSELTGSRYLANIRAWYEKCSWVLPGSKYRRTSFSTPIPREIAEAAYGVERNKILSADEKVQKACIDRILPCITEGKPFPKDIVKAAVQNVSRATAFGSYNHNKIIAVTCAIIKAYYKDKGVEVTMNVNDSNDRSYLFGRLLAVADILEQRTFDPGEKERETNARRYWSVFAKKPAKTWQIIMENLRPYMSKQAGYMSYYNKLFEEIHDKFRGEDFSNKELGSMYILGYWCQRNEMNRNNKKEEEN